MSKIQNTPNKKQSTFSITSVFLKRITRFGFTLTELIVVITILSILGTIGFIAMQSYSAKTRDSLRIADMSTALKGLAIWKASADTYPIPENSLAIYSGSGVLMSHQGYLNETLSRQIKLDKVVVDPKDKSRYVYTVDASKKKVQLMGYLESGVNISTFSYLGGVDIAYASINYQDRKIYVIGDQIGILTNNLKIPLQDIYTGTWVNLSTIDTTGIVAYFGGTTYGSGTSTGTGTILINQMLSVINNTLPCNPMTYNGYSIGTVLHNETGNFTKILSISNGSGTGSLAITCQNGTLNTNQAIETSSITCSSGFVNAGNNQCTSNLCSGTLPINTQVLSGTTQNSGQSWTHGTGVPGICVYECQNNYTWNSGSCSDMTAPTITSITTTSPACNTVRFTINGATDTIGLHATAPYSFDGGSTWQALSYKDFSSTSHTLVANLIKVRDIAGNIYTYTSSTTGTSTGCAVNGVCGASANSCNAGNPTSYSAGSCNGYQTWSCAGTGGGSTASCSIYNGECLPTWVWTYCTNGTLSGGGSCNVPGDIWNISIYAYGGGYTCGAGSCYVACTWMSYNYWDFVPAYTMYYMCQ